MKISLVLGLTEAYDENGNVLTVIKGTLTTTRKYDKLNRVTEFTDTNGNEIKYAYDADGRLKTLIYPGGKMVSYEYNQAGQLTQVTDYSNKKTSYEYDENGRLEKTTKPDGSIETIKYDKAGRMTDKRTIKTANGAEVVINDYSYGYYANGDIENETNNITSIKITLPECNTAMTYGNGNQLAIYSGQTVEHDADGNMTTGPLGDTFAAFTYNNLNMLTQAGATAYTYDGEGNRVSQTVNGQTTTYVTDPNAELSRLLMKTDPNGSTTLYVYGLGLISQEHIPAGSNTGEYLVLHYDFRGSTTALTDLSGNITDRFAYCPFGSVIGREGNTETIFQYVGMYGVQSDPNGLLFMRARYYNLQISRFINEDPIKSGLNWYAYCDNNPINLIDPLGLEYGPLGLYPNPYGENGIADLFWGIGMGVKGFAGGVVEAGRGFNDALGDLPGGSALQIAFAFTPAGMTVDGFIIADDIINNWDDLSMEEQNMILMSFLIPKPATKPTPKIKNCPDLSKANYTTPKGMGKLVNGTKMTTNQALDAASDFLGPGYRDMGGGRFVSADGARQVRMGNSDILGWHSGGSHMNFETLAPNPNKPGKATVIENIHIYLID